MNETLELRHKLKAIEEELINFYLKVKVRSSPDVRPNEARKEKEKFKGVDPLIIIEYIRTSVEIIMNMSQKPSDPNESGIVGSARAVPKDYEEIIQKLEGDVRSHIRVEQQMRLHIENI